MAVVIRADVSRGVKSVSGLLWMPIAAADQGESAVVRAGVGLVALVACPAISRGISTGHWYGQSCWIVLKGAAKACIEGDAKPAPRWTRKCWLGLGLPASVSRQK